MTITISALPDSPPQPATDEELDVRPILTRNAENAWERTEQIRTDLYHLIERHCLARRFEALVLQSAHYVHPAWVTFESWRPTNEPGITARAAATITIATHPYRRFEAIYKVAWTKHGQQGTIDQIYQFTESEIDRLVTFLSAPPAHSFARRTARRMFAPVQLRQQWYQFWKPRNKVRLVRRDRSLIASLAAVFAGASLMLMSGFAELPALSTFGLSSLTASSSVDLDPLPAEVGGTGPVGVESSPPARRPTVRSGTLDASDNRFDNGRTYEIQTITLAAGQSAVITMRSSDFDTHLTVGQFRNETFVTLADNDDAGGDGTNSRVDFVAPAAGEYVVVFSSFEAGRTGAFTFTLP
jgi:hypothetical protein